MTPMLRAVRGSTRCGAWAQRVRANREQVEEFKRGLARGFLRAGRRRCFGPTLRRRDEPTLEALRALVDADDVFWTSARVAAATRCRWRWRAAK